LGRAATPRRWRACSTPTTCRGHASSNGWKPARSAAPREAVGACQAREIGRTKGRL